MKRILIRLLIFGLFVLIVSLFILPLTSDWAKQPMASWDFWHLVEVVTVIYLGRGIVIRVGQDIDAFFESIDPKAQKGPANKDRSPDTPNEIQWRAAVSERDKQLAELRSQLEALRNTEPGNPFRKTTSH